MLFVFSTLCTIISQSDFICLGAQHYYIVIHFDLPRSTLYSANRVSQIQWQLFFWFAEILPTESGAVLNRADDRRCLSASARSSRLLISIAVLASWSSISAESWTSKLIVLRRIFKNSFLICCTIKPSRSTSVRKDRWCSSYLSKANFACLEASESEG